MTVISFFREAPLRLLPAWLLLMSLVLFAVMGSDELRYVIPLAKSLREAGVSVEIYPEAGKLKKQFDYAAKKAIPFISINGSTEIESGTINLKNLETGSQQAFQAAEMDKVLEFLK